MIVRDQNVTINLRIGVYCVLTAICYREKTASNCVKENARGSELCSQQRLIFIRR